MNKRERKLVTALRSGDYEQARKVLFDGTGYCCLGVACRVAGLKPTKTGKRWHLGCEASTLPESVQDALGWKSEFGQLVKPVLVGDTSCTSLARMNDEGASFGDIADQIENGNVAK